GRLPLTAAAVALVAGAGLAAGPAAAQQADRQLTIMTSLPNLAFPFFVHMQKELDAEAGALGNIELMRADGQGSTPKQTADVEAAIVQGVDGIVISPNEVDAMAPALEQAVEAGIPVVTIDRRVEGVDGILAHVGADNVKGGEAQGELIMELFPDGAEVFNLQGQPGASPAIDRNAGVHNVLDQHADKYPFVFEQTAQFARDRGLSVTEAGLAGLSEPPDVIVAANDDMALGALEAVRAAGLEGDIAIIGFDALPEALASVRDGGLAATIEQFPGEQSRTALRLLVDHLRENKEPEEKVILLTPIAITEDNIDKAERLGELN
ncbi:MAG TPA: substrate-binding domain-containing protein, partial [Geminicoccaceae bacterium]|nr:substrate-binding domain-containing protein [Geminicoccaceae bacterium]